MIRLRQRVVIPFKIKINFSIECEGSILFIKISRESVHHLIKYDFDEILNSNTKKKLRS